jgi:DUF971 family protein
MTTGTKPKAITLNKKEGYLEITWDDDLICRYPLPELREACPCVECRGGHQFMGREFEPDQLLTLKPARSYAIESIDKIGKYANHPTRDDRQKTGIYTRDYQRRLCPEKS